MPALTAVVAVPVRNEEKRIKACLRALDRQTGLEAGRLGIVLFLNNCTDGTAGVARRVAGTLSRPVRIVERTSPDANAGWARRAAMDEAARWLGDGGAILTTDADSRVPPDWAARNLGLLADGADAVAGRVVLDDDEAARLPERLHARGRLESRYEVLLTEIDAILDPLPHDPWPRHRTTSGASLAVRLSAYRRVGGMPPLALGEDKAFVSCLLSSDARVRHDPGVVVTTSGRLRGRAAGGAADTMRLRCEVPEAPCDPALEPLGRALVRSLWRRRVRGLHAARRLGTLGLWAPWLGIPADRAAEIARLDAAGLVWAAVEQASPRLAYRPRRPAQLGREIAAARVVLPVLRAGAWLARRARVGRGRTALPAVARPDPAST